MDYLVHPYLLSYSIVYISYYIMCILNSTYTTPPPFL